MKALLVVGLYYFYVAALCASEIFTLGELKTLTEKQGKDYTTAMIGFPSVMIAVLFIFLVLGFLIVRQL